MKKVILTGRLAKVFGPEFSLSAYDPAEAIRALCYQLPGFESELRRGVYRVTKLRKDKKSDITADELCIGFGESTTLKISPQASGSKNKGLGKLVLGVALVAGAFFFTAGAALGLGTTALTVGGQAVTYGYLAQTGALMALGGISQMLSPKIGTNTPTDQNKSFVINSLGNLTEQGNPVPVVFGRVYTGSVVVSTGVSVEELG